jgi:hypothetical protein
LHCHANIIAIAVGFAETPDLTVSRDRMCGWMPRSFLVGRFSISDTTEIAREWRISREGDLVEAYGRRGCTVNLIVENDFGLS